MVIAYPHVSPDGKSLNLLRNFPLRLFVVLAALLLVSSCADDSAMPLEDYAVRLARVLDVDLPPATDSQRYPLPRVRDLRVESAADRVDILDFLAMGDCRLQAVVAEKNSSLGRVADESGQLKLDLDFLRHGEACAAMLTAEEPALADELRRVIRLKQTRLASRIWQATLGGAEFRRFWHSDYSATIDPRTLQAIQALALDISRWLQGDYSDYDDLDQLLGIIGEGSGGGMLRAWEELGGGLQRATLAVKTFSAKRPLCYDGMQTPEADIFRRVVMKFFVGEIQKTVAGLNRTTHELMPVIHDLENRLSVAEPAAYTDWRGERDAMIEAARLAMVAHVGALEPLMVQCGFLPQQQERVNDDHQD